MTDYYTVIRCAIAERRQSTLTSRHALYERARAAQTAALQKLNPPLSKNDFDRERFALDHAIDRVEQENAGLSRSSVHLAKNQDELMPAAELQTLGSADQGQASTSKTLVSFVSKIERGVLAFFALVVLVLSPLIFVRGTWITETAVGYLAWPVDVIEKLGTRRICPLRHTKSSIQMVLRKRDAYFLRK
jgi:hypothetical protein